MNHAYDHLDTLALKRFEERQKKLETVAMTCEYLGRNNIHSIPPMYPKCKHLKNPYGVCGHSDDCPLMPIDQYALTDDEIGQIRELVRLTGMEFGRLEKVWMENRKEKARGEVDVDDFTVTGEKVDTDGLMLGSSPSAGNTKAGLPSGLPPQPTADPNNAGVGGKAEPAPR